MTIGGKRTEHNVFLAHQVDLLEFGLGDGRQERYLLKGSLEGHCFPEVTEVPTVELLQVCVKV